MLSKNAILNRSTNFLLYMKRLYISLHLRLLISGCLLLASTEGIANAAPAVPENQLKAAYLIHLSEFTTWPDEKMLPADFNICIATGSRLTASLDEIKGRIVKNKTLHIIYDVPADKLSSCHVLYIEGSLNQKTYQQSLLKTDPILTVGDDDGFTRQGGVVEFYLEGDNVKMRGNLNKMSQLKLQISSKILRLMEITP